jgi:hypothetical protein
MPGTVSAASKNQALDDCSVDGAPGNLAFSLERKKALCQCYMFGGVVCPSSTRFFQTEWMFCFTLTSSDVFFRWFCGMPYFRYTCGS